MKYLNFLIIIIIVFNSNFLNAQEQKLKNEITKNLRCLVCQGQSVYDSDTEFANSLKILVERKLDEGLSEKQIYDFFKEKRLFDNFYVFFVGNKKLFDRFYDFFVKVFWSFDIFWPFLSRTKPLDSTRL